MKRPISRNTLFAAGSPQVVSREAGAPEVSVKEHVAQIAKQLGDDITIRRFVRFQVGETAA